MPGGGPMARLPRLIGRGRALEVLLGADDIGGELAAAVRIRQSRRCPTPNSTTSSTRSRARISTFDKRAIAETKRLVDVNSLPPDAEIAPEWDAFLAALARPRPKRDSRRCSSAASTNRGCRDPARTPRRATRGGNGHADT